MSRTGYRSRDAGYYYEVHNTAFHGGGKEDSSPYAAGHLISRHRSLESAIKRKLREQKRHGDCTCGGAVLTGPEGAPLTGPQREWALRIEQTL